MSVQRWTYKHNEVGHGVYPDDKGELVAYVDYDALVSVCRELIDATICLSRLPNPHKQCDYCKAKSKALAYLDGEKNEVVK